MPITPNADWYADRAHFNEAALPSGSLLPHQVRGRQFLINNPKAILADGVGLGKTAQSLALVGHLADEGILLPGARMYRRPWQQALILCPAGLCDQWEQQVRLLLPCFKVAIDPLAPHWPQFDVLILSIDKTSTRRGYWGLPWALVIVDEASKLKGAGVRHEATLEVTAKAARVVGLTATPYEVNPLDTLALVELLHVPMPWTRHEFGERFVEWGVFDGRREPIGAKEANLPELRQWLSTVALRHTAALAGISNPTVNCDVRWVPLTHAQRTAYDTARKISHAAVRRHGTEQATEFAGAKGSEVSSKVDAAMDILAENPSRKAIVWAEHTRVLDILKRHVGALGLRYVEITGKTRPKDRDLAVAAFRDDPYVRLLIGTNAFARGVDGLQCGDLLISLGMTWNPAHEIQREGRLSRLNSPNTSVDHIYVLTDTAYERGKWDRVRGRQAHGDFIAQGMEAAGGDAA